MQISLGKHPHHPLYQHIHNGNHQCSDSRTIIKLCQVFRHVSTYTPRHSNALRQIGIVKKEQLELLLISHGKRISQEPEQIGTHSEHNREYPS